MGLMRVSPSGASGVTRLYIWCSGIHPHNCPADSTVDLAVCMAIPASIYHAQLEFILVAISNHLILSTTQFSSLLMDTA
jgi:hypothetical protein